LLAPSDDENLGYVFGMIDATLRRVFVVAAHPDDDTIGCGGMLAMACERGAAVRVAYLTDGSRSHPGSRRFSSADVAAMREIEAADALAELGIAEAPYFFREPDSALGSLDAGARTRVVSRLTELLRSFAPELVLAPWERDPHPDHIAAAAIARLAFETARVPGSAFAGYDVWLSIRGTVLDAPQPGEAMRSTVELSESARIAKRRALFAHRSQTSDLIDDDPAGFRITEELADRWLGPTEHFFFPIRG
jgi:LmbE family N-acetylglucosaminyl deacetylase